MKKLLTYAECAERLSNSEYLDEVVNPAISSVKGTMFGEKSGDRHKRDFPEQHSVGFSRLTWPSGENKGVRSQKRN